MFSFKFKIFLAAALVAIVVGLLPTVALAETVAPSAEVEVISPAHYAGQWVPTFRRLYGLRNLYRYNAVPKIYFYGSASYHDWKYTGTSGSAILNGRIVTTYQVTKTNVFGTVLYSMTIR